jgi:hypothetical protein
MMKTTKLESKKILKVAKSRCVAGVQIRSGLKAGRHFGSGKRGLESEIGRGGRDSDIPGRIG